MSKQVSKSDCIADGMVIFTDTIMNSACIFEIVNCTIKKYGHFINILNGLYRMLKVGGMFSEESNWRE